VGAIMRGKTGFSKRVWAEVNFIFAGGRNTPAYFYEVKHKNGNEKK
jgi:hypothetical protein